MKRRSSWAAAAAAVGLLLTGCAHHGASSRADKNAPIMIVDAQPVVQAHQPAPEAPGPAAPTPQPAVIRTVPPRAEPAPAPTAKPVAAVAAPPKRPTVLRQADWPAMASRIAARVAQVDGLRSQTLYLAVPSSPSAFEQELGAKLVDALQAQGLQVETDHELPAVFEIAAPAAATPHYEVTFRGMLRLRGDTVLVVLEDDKIPANEFSRFLPPNSYLGTDGLVHDRPLTTLRIIGANQ